jgi:hypothetical protein
MWKCQVVFDGITTIIIRQMYIFFRGRSVLRGIFGMMRDEMTGKWRKLHNEELRDLYSSASIVRMIKSRFMRWTRHVARIG